MGAPLHELLQRNDALGMPDREAFIRWVLSRQASFPDSYRKIKAVNVGLLPVDEAQAEELELGKNQCALGGEPLA